MTLLAWPIEVGSRELDERLLFALAATRRGFSVLSGTKTSVTEASVVTRHQVTYIHKSASKKQLARFRALQAAGVKVVVHDEEGLVTNEQAFAPRLHAESLAHVDRYLYYGERQRRLALNLGACPGRSTVAGHPRYDLLSGDLSGFYQNQSELWQRGFGRYVLVAAMDRSISAQLALAEKLLQKNLVDSIVVKLHPGGHVPLPPLDRQAIEVISPDEVIGPLILGAEVLLHDASTTALAASLVNVAAVNFAPTSENGFVADDRVFGTSVDSVKSSDLARLLNGSLADPSKTGDILHSVEDSACERMLSVLQSDGAEPGGEKSVYQKLRQWRPKKSLSDLSEHGRFKAGSMEPEHVAPRLEAMAIALGVQVPEIRFFGDSAFMIHPS